MYNTWTLNLLTIYALNIWTITPCKWSSVLHSYLPLMEVSFTVLCKLRPPVYHSEFQILNGSLHLTQKYRIASLQAKPGERQENRCVFNMLKMSINCSVYHIYVQKMFVRQIGFIKDEIQKTEFFKFKGLSVACCILNWSLLTRQTTKKVENLLNTCVSSKLRESVVPTETTEHAKTGKKWLWHPGTAFGRLDVFIRPEYSWKIMTKSKVFFFFLYLCTAVCFLSFLYQHVFLSLGTKLFWTNTKNTRKWWSLL